MPDIKPIGKSTVHHICSGQVILDLTTAVKELVENSLDAGATAVEVKLKEYGLEQIEVIDNGCGVEEENFQSLTLKHHTSKLRDFSDLVSVATFGFRGEALSSLCALCNVTICTRHKTNNVGCKLEFDHDGIIKKKTKLARQIGTTVTLTNLFATLPVRQKEFKRNIKKEYTKLVNVMSAYCLISTKARMSCSNQTSKGQRNVVLSTQPTGKIEDNIQSLFTSRQLKTVTKFVQVKPTQEICDEFGLKYEDMSRAYEEYHVSGQVTSQEGGGRSSPDRQFIFVNSRPVDLPKLTKSINQIYRQRLNRHQYPFVLLNVEMERSKVDVNVTPDKRKVFLQHEKILLAIVKTSLFNLYKLDDRQVATIQPSTPKQLGFFSTSSPTTTTTNKRKISLDDGDGSFFDNSFNDSLNSNDSSFVEEKKTSKSAVGGFNMLSSFRMGSKKSKQCCDVGQRRLESFNITTASSSLSSPSGVKSLSKNDQIASLRQEPQEGTPLRQVPLPSSKKDHSLLARSGSDDSASAELALVSRQEEEKLVEKEETADEKLAEVVERKKPSSIWTLYGNTQASQGKAEKSGQSSALDSVAGLKPFTRNFEAASSESSCENKEKCSGDSSLAEKKLMSNNRVEIIEGGRKREEQKNDDNSKTMTVSYDDVESGNNENHCDAVKEVKFSMKRVGELVARRKQLQDEEDCKSQQGGSSSFRAKIAPSQNCRAEEELSRNLNKASFDRMSIIGQFNLGFIVARLDGDLFIIDQHATDEIYNFEKLQESTEVHQQHLVVPKKLNLSAPEQMTLKQHIRVFERNGFGFIYRIEEDKEVVYLSDVPHSGDHSLGSDDVDELIFMLTDSSPLDQSLSSNFPRPSRLRKIFASRACRKSVMIGTALSKHEMRRLLRHMSEINHPWNCPHGRPTIRHLVDLSKIKGHKSS